MLSVLNMTHRTCKCLQFIRYLYVKHLCTKKEIVEKIASICAIKTVYHAINLHFLAFRAKFSIVRYSGMHKENLVLAFS